MRHLSEIILLDEFMSWDHLPEIRCILGVQFEHPDMLTLVVRDVRRRTIAIKGRPVDVIAWLAQRVSQRKVQHVLRLIAARKKDHERVNDCMDGAD